MRTGNGLGAGPGVRRDSLDRRDRCLQNLKLLGPTAAILHSVPSYTPSCAAEGTVLMLAG
jgi:hypothetical protein